MATNYPSGLDTFTDPTPTTYENVVSHAGQHSNANDAIAAVEVELGVNPSGVSGSVAGRALAIGGRVALDDPTLSGVTGSSTDDQRMAAVMSYAGAQTYPPTIVLQNRAHSFGSGIAPYNGFRLAGPGGPNDAEKGGGGYNTCSVSLTMSGAWLNPPSNPYWSWYISGISFQGTSSTTWLAGGSDVAWRTTFYDLSFNGFLSIIGTAGSKVLIDNAAWDRWDIANCASTAIHVGGSDCMGLFPTECLIDSSAAGNGNPHVHLDSLEKCNIGPMYITGRNGWVPVVMDGPAYNGGGGGTNGGPVNIHGAALEGQNAGNPSYGAVVRVNGGILRLIGCHTEYAMSNPSSTGYPTSPADQGAIQVNGGKVSVLGGFYDKASSVAATVPYLYNYGGVATVVDVSVGNKGGTWTGLPYVTAAAAAPGLGGYATIVDQTVQLTAGAVSSHQM